MRAIRFIEIEPEYTYRKKDVRKYRKEIRPLLGSKIYVVMDRYDRNSENLIKHSEKVICTVKRVYPQVIELEYKMGGRVLRTTYQLKERMLNLVQWGWV